MLESFKSEIRNHILKGNVKKAFSLMMDALSDESEITRMIFILSGEFKRTLKRFHGGLMNLEDFNVYKNKIIDSILFHLDELKTEDLKGLNTKTDKLWNAIKTLPFRSIGKLHLVNCDRNKAHKKYTEFFRPRQKLPHQFYFCVGCPTQKPASFAERLIYEIIDNVLIDDEAAIDYERMSISVKGSNIERLCFQALPFGIDRHSSKLKFQKYFGERFQHLGLDKYSIEDFVSKQGLILPYKYFVFAFEIEADDLDDEMIAYLQWIIDTFRKVKLSTSSHLFFFVINMPEAHKELNEPVIKRLQNLVENSREDCLLITDYYPVPQDEILKWFRRTNNNPNPNQYREILDHFGKDLIQKNRWDGHSDYNMMDVEELQELVYHIYLKHSEKELL